MDQLIEHPDADALAADVAARVASWIGTAVETRGKATLALSGGRTPGTFMTTLGEVDLPWDKVAVTLTDERCVPGDHERSNARLVHETLFAGPARAAAFLPLYTGPDSLDAANALSALLPIDVGVFGMGEDYHTASLFPGADGAEAALRADAPSPLALISSADLPDTRISLTAPAIRSARHRILLLTGAQKRAAYLRGREIGDPIQAPVNILFHDIATEVHWAP